MRSLIWVALAAAAVGCSSDKAQEGEDCTEDNDCAAGLHCMPADTDNPSDYCMVDGDMEM